MAYDRRLPTRELAFLRSLKRHGFKVRSSTKDLKKKYGYVIPANAHDEAGGIDFWVKLPKQNDLIPVQVTQRGTYLFKKYRKECAQLEAFEVRAMQRLKLKRTWCKAASIAFVLIRDYDSEKLSTVVAWGDKKALMHGIENWRSV